MFSVRDIVLKIDLLNVYKKYNPHNIYKHYMPKASKKSIGKSAKKPAGKAKKDSKKQDIPVTDDADSDSEVLLNESETKNNKEDAQNEAPEGDEFEEAQDSEVEDEDKLDEDVEIEEEEDEVSDESEAAEAAVTEDGEYKEKCIYKYAEEASDDEFDDINEEIFSDDKDDQTVPERVPDTERITKPIMTKYEMVRLLGIRTRQIALGAKPMIKNTDNLSSKEIAALELKMNMIPLIIIRPLPNGRKEYWKVSELQH